MRRGTAATAARRSSRSRRRRDSRAWRKLRATLGGPLDGTLAAEMVVDAEGAVRAPEHLTDEEAATLPCAALTAWNALFGLGSVGAGDLAYAAVLCDFFDHLVDGQVRRPVRKLLYSFGGEWIVLCLYGHV